jgi:D-glycero-D-manno-heptose 1,7-bisphosphate phosphatase
LSVEDPSAAPRPSHRLPDQIDWVMVDRDGTLIEYVRYLSDPAQVKLFPQTVTSLQKFARLGLKVAVITNQAGIGRGEYAESDLNAVNDQMLSLMQAAGVGVDRIFHCPHAPEEHCPCRKPATELAQNAADQFGFKMEHSVVIGDNISDVEMGWHLGVPSMLVRTGLGSQYEAQVNSAGGIVVDDILQAAETIETMISDTGTESPGA